MCRRGLAPAPRDDARGAAGAGVDPGEPVGRGAQGGADVRGLAAELAARTDQDERAPDLARA